MRLRAVLSGRLRAIVEETAHVTGRATHVCVVAVGATTSGLRAVVGPASPTVVRRFARRAIALLALQMSHVGVRWRPVTRARCIAPHMLPVYLRYIASCRAFTDGDMSVRNRKNGTKSVKRAIRQLQVIERSNETLLGADETAARIRRWVASHEAPSDDRAAFGKLCLVIFAQGVGFEIIEKHRDALEGAFCGFAPAAVAAIDDSRVGARLHEPIIRNRAKIEACIQKARRWQELVSTDGSYLGRMARIGADDDAAAGWPRLVAALQEDFCDLGEPTARFILKRWGFFTALALSGVRRVLNRLGFVDEAADGPAVQRFVGAVADVSGRDAYALEAVLAIFAGLGACRFEPRCAECTLNERCPSAQLNVATAND